METLGEFSCRDCRMDFHSLELLEKHKVFFCIGSDVGDPVALRRGVQERRDHRRDDGKGVYPKQAGTPDLVRLRGQRGINPRNPHGAQPIVKREDRHLIGLTESSALQNLAEEVPGDQLSGRQQGHREKLREMTAQHGRQLAQIQAQTHLLEQQKEEIAHQLGVLAGQGSTAHLETLLLELKEQEERNEEALGELREHITSLQAPQGPDGNDDERKRHHVTFDLISSVDGPLHTQIRALRLAYMQSGGSDPAVLAQIHDLQAEAHTLEQAQPVGHDRTRRNRIKPSQRARNPEVLEMEQENQRLEEEILRIQLAKGKHRGEEGSMGSDLHHMQREHIHHMASIQAEIESLRRDVQKAREDPRQRRQAPPPPPPLPFLSQPAMHPLAQMHASPALPQPRPHSSLLGRRIIDSLDSLGPAPYDPAAGFVIFFDLVLGVDATLQVLRLVSGLYSGGQEVGRPTPLPPVHCQPGGALPYAHSLPPGNYALLSVKQPVPRMQPSGSFSLVVEVQAAGGLDECGQEIQRLASCGWARLDLFDPHNQVRSGHWRAPVRSLPVRPALSPGQLNSIPQVGSMELCVRVVNARDGDVQTLAKIDPSNTTQYKYPSMVSTHPAMLQANPPPPLSTVLMFGDTGLHCCTSTARSSTAPGNFIFGEQQIALSGLAPREDMILLLRFYLRPVGSSVPFSGLVKQRESPPWELEDLVGNLAEMGEFLSETNSRPDYDFLEHRHPFRAPVCVEGALNLPWAAFTLGLCSLSPPGAFYQGVRWATYDPPLPLLDLDPSSSTCAPRWRDGCKSFSERVSHQHFIAIIHLHAVSAVSFQDRSDPQSSGEEQGDGLSFSLEDQCWAAAPVSPEGEGQIRHHQLPLYQGAPSQNTDISQLPVDQLASYTPQPTPPKVPSTPLPDETLTSQLAARWCIKV
ncbi:coiled-coil domain-containing protein 17 [Hypomesus transpacificus]|uniref:coiled-coil domain-containing protein 17 n=1 Tax=Hypomesus transpacificus TaxID=137520 RepID=UPI001F076528|nr:coiled-coil domain-containing protein 17 [Hypomesus transpacificus]